MCLDAKHRRQEHHYVAHTGGQRERKMWKEARTNPVTDDLPYMFATLCEYASGVCDTEYDVDQFFDDMELYEGAERSNYVFSCIVRQARERGLLPPLAEVDLNDTT